MCVHTTHPHIAPTHTCHTCVHMHAHIHTRAHAGMHTRVHTHIHKHPFIENTYMLALPRVHSEPTFIFYSFGFVEYSSVDEAKAVVENKENIILNGHTLYVNYGKVD